jgi:hypothetical protein
VALEPRLSGHGSKPVEAKLLPGQVAHVLPHSALHSQNGRGRFVVDWSPDQSLKHREVHIVHPAKNIKDSTLIKDTKKQTWSKRVVKTSRQNQSSKPVVKTSVVQRCEKEPILYETI